MATPNPTPPTDPNHPVTGYPAPPNGTAYPYPQQPQQQHHQSYYYPQNQNQNYQYYPNPNSIRRANCLRRIFAAIIATIVIFGTITFIVWLVLRPQLPDFRVDSLTFTNFTLTNSSLITFSSVIGLTARNPNKKMVLKYDRVEAEVFYRQWSLADTVLTPFEQGVRSEGPIEARFAAGGSFVERRAGEEMREERGRRGGLVLNLRMVASVRFEAKAWRTRRRYLKVYCGDLDVGGLSGGGEGRLRGGARQCRVGI